MLYCPPHHSISIYLNGNRKSREYKPGAFGRVMMLFFLGALIKPGIPTRGAHSEQCLIKFITAPADGDQVLPFHCYAPRASFLRVCAHRHRGVSACVAGRGRRHRAPLSVQHHGRPRNRKRKKTPPSLPRCVTDSTLNKPSPNCTGVMRWIYLSDCIKKKL